MSFFYTDFLGNKHENIILVAKIKLSWGNNIYPNTKVVLCNYLNKSIYLLESTIGSDQNINVGAYIDSLPEIEKSIVDSSDIILNVNKRSFNQTKSYDLIKDRSLHPVFTTTTTSTTTTTTTTSTTTTTTVQPPITTPNFEITTTTL